MRILETVLYAEDLHAARHFYVELLGLEAISFNPERSLFLRLSGSVLIVFRAAKSIIPDAGVPPHGCSGPGHMAFSAGPGDIDSWRLRLQAANVKILQEITWENGARSLYFPDPAGNVLEFAEPLLWDIEY